MLNFLLLIHILITEGKKSLKLNKVKLNNNAIQYIFGDVSVQKSGDKCGHLLVRNILI